VNTYVLKAQNNSRMESWATDSMTFAGSKVATLTQIVNVVGCKAA